MTSWREKEPEAFDRMTNVDEVVPTYENAADKRPFQGGNALVQEREEIDGSGSLVLSEFEVHLRVQKTGDSRKAGRWKFEFYVDHSEGVVRPTEAEKKKRGDGTQNETVRLKEFAVGIARAEKVAVEFAERETPDDAEFVYRGFDSILGVALGETKEATIVELGDLPEKTERDQHPVEQVDDQEGEA